MVTDGHDSADAPPTPRFSLKRLLPLVAVVIGFIAFFALGLDRYIDFYMLKENRGWLSEQVATRAVLSALAFMGLYATMVALSVPGGTVMTIAGGFLFGPVLACVYVVVSATLGATVLFQIAKTALGDVLRARAGPFVRRMEVGFRENALAYLLVLRLIPLFPFWLVNLVPAFLGVPLRTFVIGTFFGIVPGTLVYSLVGDGFGALIELGGEPNLYTIFEPRILAPITGLAILVLAPVIYRKLATRRGAA